MKIKCTFRKGGFKGQVYYKEFPCFSLKDSNLPEYIPKSEFPEVVKFISENDYIQTSDDWIVPVIKAWQNFFRIPKGGTYSRWHVKKGQKVYFEPPREHKLIYEYSAFGKRGSGKRLTRMQKRFCWEFAKCGDSIVALRLAGYTPNSDKYDQIYAHKLMSMPKIKRGIREALGIHMKAADKAENQFVVEGVGQKCLKDFLTYSKKVALLLICQLGL